MITLKLAIRNLLRNTRRTILTAILIVIGVVLVVVATSVTEGFRASVIDVLTNTQLSHFQVHKAGYQQSSDSAPLNIYLNEDEMSKLSSTFDQEDSIEVYSPRIKFISNVTNGTDTSNILINAVYPDKESAACPGIVELIDGAEGNPEFLKPGEIIIPDVVASGLSIAKGDTVTLKCTDRNGAMHSISLVTAGIMTTFESPSGRSGYMHIDDAKTLLDMTSADISEVAVRVKNADKESTLKGLTERLESSLGSSYEVQTWDKLSPFSSILVLVNLVNIMVQCILIAIVLISVLNIMIMSVYERTHEIGTIAAIGTTPGKILRLFITEGIMLGIISSVTGSLLGALIGWLLNSLKIHFKAGPYSMVLNGEINLSNILIIIILVSVVSLAASFQPSFKAAKLEPVDALGHI